MKIWLFAVVLAFAVAAASAAAVSEVAAGKYLAKDKTDVDVAVTDVPEAESDAEAKVETEGEEESETEGKEGEKEEEGSNESSSEENEEEEKEEEESSTNHQADEQVTTVKVLGYVPVVYTTETYVKPTYVPTAAAYIKSNYIQIPGPVYKPVVTTEAPKPTVTYPRYNVVKTEISAPAVVETVETPKTESKYVKPVVAAVVETTTKYSPIVFEKPSSAPVVTVRKSGWVRAPGYNLGYARSENSDPAVVETPKTSATRSEPLATAKTVVSPLADRQWFYKPQ